MLAEAGHVAIQFSESGVAKGSADTIVCTVAEASEAILVAHDGDMKQLAKSHGISGGRFKALSLLKLECSEDMAAARIKSALSLIEHEWSVAPIVDGRRKIFVVVGKNTIRTHR